MAETRKIVQLHKKDDKNDRWIPLTTGRCVQLTDYENTGETGAITDEDTLNNALAKLENRKADSGETLSAYGISDAYTKDEIDAKLGGIYRVRGGLLFANIPTKLADANTAVGDVYNLLDGGTMTSDFVEYESGVTKTVPMGTNIVVVNTGTEEFPVLKFDVLAMSASQTQVQSDWDEADSSSPAYIDNKPTIPTVNDATLTIQQNNVTVNTFTANASSDVTINLVDTQYESKSAANGGTDVSLVTTGEKYVWNGKQDALPSGSGKNGKCLKVVDNNGTMSWEDDNDTHYTATLVLGGSSATSNATSDTANNATYLNTVENNLKSGGVQITGSGTVSVSAANGVLTITGTDPIPSQSGNNNKFLMTNGTTLSWGTPSDLNTFRVIQVDNTQLLATDANKAFDIIAGKNITLTTDDTQSGYASMTIDVTVADVTNPTITSNTLAVEYGKNYFVGSSTATAAGVAAAQNGVTTLSFTMSGNSGFEANVFFKAGAAASGMNIILPSGFLLIGDEPEYVSGNVYLISFYKGTAIFGEMTVSQQ